MQFFKKIIIQLFNLFSEFKIQEISSTQFFGQALTLEERTFSRGYTQASQSMLVCGYLLKLVQIGP